MGRRGGDDRWFDLEAEGESEGQWIDDWLEESVTAGEELLETESDPDAPTGTRPGTELGPDGEERSAVEKPLVSTSGQARRRIEVLPAMPDPAAVYKAAFARGARTIVMSTQLPPRVVPPVTLRVGDLRLDSERLDSYCRLIGDRPGGSGGDGAPPGFVHVSVFGLQLALLARTDFPLPMIGLVHVSQRVEQLRPVTMDDTLVASTWARRLATRPLGNDSAGTQVEIVTEVRSGTGDADAADLPSPGGEVVWQGVSTYLAKQVTLRDLPVVARSPREAFVPPIPTGGWTTSKATSREYGRVSQDRNPIHASTLAARTFGFPRQIAHGMDTAARALAALGPQRGEAFTWTTDFAAPVLVPGRVAVRVEPAVDLDETGDGARPGWRMTAWDPSTGRLHLRSALAHA